jgi:large subunit ribosomal protein L24
MSRQKVRIKSGDTVKVVTGKAKGSIGRVVRVDPVSLKIVVEGINQVKRHRKPAGGQPGGVDVKDAPMDISNVALWDTENNCTIKVGYSTDSTGAKVRVNRVTGSVIAAD